jgi:hypothetical protein
MRRPAAQDAETRVQKVFYATLSITGGNAKRAACSIYTDLEAVSAEISVPPDVIQKLLMAGTGISPEDCPSKRARTTHRRGAPAPISPQ